MLKENGILAPYRDIDYLDLFAELFIKLQDGLQYLHLGLEHFSAMVVCLKSSKSRYTAMTPSHLCTRFSLLLINYLKQNKGCL